jgi:hypothetical protein
LPAHEKEIDSTKGGSRMSNVQLTVAFAMLILFGMAPEAVQGQNTSMSFFITSQGPGNGANLGGLAGADALCQKLVATAGRGTKPGARISARSRWTASRPLTRASASAKARGITRKE